MRVPARCPAASHSLGVAAACLVALAPPGPAEGQRLEVTPAGTYPSGSAPTSPLTGIAFEVPDGYSGQWDGDATALVFRADEVLAAVWGWSEGTIEDAAAELEGRLSAVGIHLTPRESPTFHAEQLTGTFDVVTAEGAGLLTAEIRRGPDGQIAAVAAMGRDASRLDAFVADVVSSLRWSQPGAAAWRSRVEGSMLEWSGGGSDMSSGATTATGVRRGNATLAFCGGGYRYTESSESYVSIEGVSASSSSSDEHAGEWYLVADLAGSPTLYLFSTDGRSFVWSVSESSDGYVVDGYLYSAVGGC